MTNFIYPQFGDGGGGGGGASGPLPLASAGTWVAINGNGFANIPNATAVLFLADTATANYIPTDWTGPRVVVSDFTDFAGSVRIYARLAEISGDNGVYAWFGIVSEVNNYYRGIRIRADNGAVQTRLDGGAGTNHGVILQMELDGLLMIVQAGHLIGILAQARQLNRLQIGHGLIVLVIQLLLTIKFLWH